jgi:Type I phosphodiesterase / nucleotide pyrophosphatase
VPDQSVDQLRVQLRDRGYLSHGIERWFALDPLSSRTFWIELAVVAAKAAALIAAFAILPLVGVDVARNLPLTATETLLMALLYGITCFAAAFVYVIAIALILKLRPEVAIDTPRALLGISLAASAAMAFPLAVWWRGFETAPAAVELGIGIVLIALFFLTSTIVISAALLSFSVYELRRVPAIHRRSRTIPMAAAAAALIALLFLPAYAAKENRTAAAPLQIVTTPSVRPVAFVAVDGLTYDLYRSRPLGGVWSVIPLDRMSGQSTTERWASIGTGVPMSVHGVRAVEGVRFRGGRHVIQSVSRRDFVLRDIAERVGVAQRQPLPPTVRRRDFVWEIFAARGVPSVAVDWWTTESSFSGVLDTIGQQTIFSAAKGDAVKVDQIAAWHLLAGIDRDHPRFATVYLPALDVVLNRLGLDQSAQLATSLQALDGVAAVVHELDRRGYAVILTGLPGDRQKGLGVLASTLPLVPKRASPFDIAPTLCAIEGFPVSEEMPGKSLTGVESSRIATYGARTTTAAPAQADQEYYRNLKSLGYIH